MRFVRSLIVLLVGLLAGAGCTGQADQGWTQEEGYRWRPLNVESEGDTGFRRLDSSDTGVSFVNRLTEDEISENQTYLNGSGVAAGDVNGDGRTDLYFARLHGPNRLYENQGGFEFLDVTDSAGVAHEGAYSSSAVLADVDGDRDPDLLVGSISNGVTVYLNDGAGHFTKQSNQHFERGKGTMTLALADIDGDADLDLYVSNYKEKSVKDLYPREDRTREKTTRTVPTESDTELELVSPFDQHYRIIERKGQPNPRRETGERDALYINQGDGRFQKATSPEERFRQPSGEPGGLALDWGLNASFRDLNRDGHPDLYVNNDYWTPDRVWVNRGNGTFRPIDSLAFRSASLSSMTVDFADFNRDGALDVFVTEMLSPLHSRRLRQVGSIDPFPTTRVGDRPQYNRNSLYLNRGDGTYAEIAYFSGMEATEWSWATRFLDVDFDSYEDLLVNTGFSYDVQDLDSQIRVGRKIMRGSGNQRFITEYPRLRLENKSFRNEQDLTFAPRSQPWGFSTQKDVSHGLATADFDRDGDLDLAVNRLNAPAALYENRASAPRIAVRLVGTAPNTAAIGALVSLEGGPGGPAPQREEITEGGDYLSDSASLVTFAAAPDRQDHVLTVRWPDGTTSIIEGVRTNRLYEIRQSDMPVESTSSGSTPSGSEPIFEDVSNEISHRHHESEKSDFQIQPLLPVKLSQQGPGVSWIDYDRDGDDDLFVGSGRGRELAVYENDGEESFTERSLGTLTETAPGDQTTVLGWPTDEGTEVWVGTQNYEAGAIEAPSALRYSVRGDQAPEEGSVPGILSTTGPLAMADYDGDGDLDLFVGGRFVPGLYPKDATSRLFMNREEGFVRDSSHARQFADLGLVTGAVFTDYDRDGDPDLLISRAWGTLMLFENEGGEFRDVTENVGLDAYKGWWNGVATGDFNGDGQPDIVATNWGTNSPYQLDNEHPLKMYYWDFNDDRRMEIIESYYDPAVGGYVPRRRLPTFMSTPVTVRSKTNKQFANASLTELLGGDPDRHLSSKAINTLQSTVFLNEGGTFSAHPLPDEAQFTAASHAEVFDYNNDGNEDLFLSQNFFEVRPEFPRLDAGRGLLLRGDGRGQFEVVPGQQSGIKAYGEQRGAAASDFNGDGAVDLAVTQNDFITRLYENQTSKSGLSIRLVGPPENRAGIGASLRLVYPDGSKGPRRTVQAGAGYWSQSSLTQVLGYSQFPAKIEVTWPDGGVTIVDVSEETLTYRIHYPGFEDS